MCVRRARSGMPRQGPCRIDGCADPNRPSGQWQFIPEAYCNEHDLTFEEDCTCKKAACLRKCGLKPEKQPPGRKRPAESPPVGVALHEEELPRPPVILSMDEIWNDRLAAPARVRSASRPLLTTLTMCVPPRRVRARRCANIDEMGAVARRNKLKYARADTLEYAVHGKWRRSEDDENGEWGCWYIGVPELVQTFGKATVTAKLIEYEAELAAARTRAIEDAEEPAEAAGEEGGGGVGS